MRATSYDDIEALQTQIEILEERADVAERNLRNVTRELDAEIRVLEKMIADETIGPSGRHFYGDACRQLKRIRGWADFHKVEAVEAREGEP